MKTVIKVEDVSKQYRLGKIGTGSFAHDVNRWWYRMRGKEDPYLKIGEVSDRSIKVSSEYIWALRNVSFDVKQGDVVGIIGKNGAGKSTLLKILSRTTLPTTGGVKVKGRIASLLEVGTGFHPELTGRENIFLNGAILGMTKKEIRAKFDEIVDFSGVEKYIDTPVKRYSSGMYVRLAFGVAAHLEPEILIVDEVLAVGDAEFQKKALGKMEAVSKGEGRTVLFVSHNMSAVSALCKSTVVLENGVVVYNDSAENGIAYYLNHIIKNVTKNAWDNGSRPGNETARLVATRLVSPSGTDIQNVDVNQKFGVEITFEVMQDNVRLFPNIHFFSKKNEYLFVSGMSKADPEVRAPGIYTVTVWVPSNLLNEGGYIAGVALSSFNPTKVHFYEREALVFDVAEENYNNRGNDFIHKIPGFFRPSLNWDLNTITKK